MGNPSLGEYRYHPGDDNIISQFGFVSNGNQDQNYWVPLGTLEFSSAVKGVSYALALGAASIITMSVF